MREKGRGSTAKKRNTMRRHPFQPRTGYEKKHTLRYIAGPPAALRGTQPSQAIMLVKPSASGAKAAPAPVMQTNCRASVFSGRQRGCALCRELLLQWP